MIARSIFDVWDSPTGGHLKFGLNSLSSSTWRGEKLLEAPIASEGLYWFQLVSDRALHTQVEEEKAAKLSPATDDLLSGEKRCSVATWKIETVSM